MASGRHLVRGSLPHRPPAYCLSQNRLGLAASAASSQKQTLTRCGMQTRDIRQGKERKREKRAPPRGPAVCLCAGFPAEGVDRASQPRSGIGRVVPGRMRQRGEEGLKRVAGWPRSRRRRLEGAAVGEVASASGRTASPRPATALPAARGFRDPGWPVPTCLSRTVLRVMVTLAIL